MSKASHLMNNYGKRDIAFSHGKGCYLYDSKGQRYMDGIAGIAVNVLGHAHPAFSKAISAQVKTLIHVSNLYQIPEQEKLAKVLCQKSGMEQVFFCNSGTESNEAAIKIARRYGHNRGVSKPRILVMEGAFHGRSMGSLAATANAAYKKGFTPMLPGFVRVAYNDLKAASAALRNDKDIVAILVEPVQGEGGVVKPADDYLNGLRKLCDRYQALLMLDEVQTGNGRCGKYFAFQHNKILPDVLCTAKGLGNGYPVGACMVAGRAKDILQPGHHGSTFGGSQLASVAGLAVYDALARDKLVANSAARGKQLLKGLQKALRDCPAVVEIRGTGLLLGIELDRPCGELVQAARAKGLLLNVASGTVVRLAPPLILNEKEADKMIKIVSEIIQEFVQ